MYPTMPTIPFTIDDAVMRLVGSDQGEDYAGQELSHSQLTSLVERMGWHPSTSEKFSNTPKGLVSKWLGDRRIPMHPRTRRVKFDDLVLAAGRLEPTSPRTIERQAMAEQEQVNKRLMLLRSAASYAEQQVKALDRTRDYLFNQLEGFYAQIDAAEAEEQRRYDDGDRINTFPRLNITL